MKFADLNIGWKLAISIILTIIALSTGEVFYFTKQPANEQKKPITKTTQTTSSLPSVQETASSLPSVTESASTTPSPTETKKESKISAKSPGQSSSASPDSSDSPSPSDSPSSDSSNSPNPSSSLSSDNSSGSSLSSCGINYSFLSASPVNLNEFNGLVPLGNINPSGHTFPTDHIYFYFNINTSRNLYSPGKVIVTQISANQNITQGTSDYSIDLQPCSELTIYFLHVTTLSSKLATAFTSPFDWDNTYTTGGNTYRNYGRKTNISADSGEQLGTVGGNPGQSSFDMGAYDTRVTLNFINPRARPNSIHTVCPIDYYSGDLKTTLMGRFGDYDGDPKRTVEPVCGSIDQDVAGTAQGVWLTKGTTHVSGEDPHLALIHNNIYPNKAVFSVGTSMSASNLHVGYYEFYPQNSGLINRDFDDVQSDGNIYCYEMDGSGWVKGNITILAQLPTPATLKIERGTASSCGSGPWSFSSNASEFERQIN